tara:strand:+ start:178 stop:699 length:522 start_codon:yes stop_codon:yes gene_type:complete
MKEIKTIFKDVKIYQGKKFYDKRGFLEEVFVENKIKKRLVFSIVSKSHKGVLRGLHLQTTKAQDKFITVLKGQILDVIVDLRKKSKTFGKHFKIILSEKNCKFLFIPKGFAHGFLGLSKENIVLYSCSNYRNKKSEKTIRWNDVNLKINWGIKKPVLSKKDRNAQTFDQFSNK